MKNNNFFYGLVIASICIFNADIYAPGANTAVNANFGCTGYCPGGTKFIGSNAAGDRRTMDTKSLVFKDLGTVSAAKNISLPIPDGMKRFGYKATFPQGEINTPMKFLGNFESEGDQYMYKFFRQVAGDNLWTEVGEMYPDGKLDSLNFTLNPNGTLVFTGDNGQAVTLYLATQNLGKPKSQR